MCNKHFVIFFYQFGHHSVTLNGGERTDGTEEALLKAVAQQPVAVAMDHNNDEFMFYSEVTQRILISIQSPF